MANKLRLAKRMLSLGQSRKVLIAYRTRQAPLFSKLAPPLAMTLLVLAPVVLPLRGKLPLMVRTYLPR
jgi:hypothetical protein